MLIFKRLDTILNTYACSRARKNLRSSARARRKGLWLSHFKITKKIHDIDQKGHPCSASARPQPLDVVGQAHPYCSRDQGLPVNVLTTLV